MGSKSLITRFTRLSTLCRFQSSAAPRFHQVPKAFMKGSSSRLGSNMISEFQGSAKLGSSMISEFHGLNL